MNTHGFIPTDDAIALSDRLEAIVEDTTLDRSIRATADRYLIFVLWAAIIGDTSRVDAAIRFIAEIEDGRHA